MQSVNQAIARSLVIITLEACGFWCCADFALATEQPSSAPPTGIELTADAQRVSLQTSEQRVQFDLTEAEQWQLSTYVRHENAWVPFFDGRQPLIRGSQFDLKPVAYEILENSNRRKAVLFRGQHALPSYAWNVLVELHADSPLIKFTVTCGLPQGLQIDSPQPMIALWLEQPSAEFTLDQGPASQTGTVYRVPFNFGFPAAYLWDRQREAVVFFNMSPMTWFSPHGVHRFLDVQIKSEAQGDHLGLGLHTHHLSGSSIPAGPMVSEFYLFSQHREDPPTKFQALDQMVRACAPLHPAESEFPQNTLEGGDVSWEAFASRVIRDLMEEDFACARLSKPWQDRPLSLVASQSEMIVHPDWLPRDSTTLPVRWNFSTVNHHLAPWLLFAQVHPAANIQEFARIKANAVPRFYDPTSRMIRSFLPPLPSESAKEISWQSYVFVQEIFQIDEASTAEDFNPAILGRALLGLEGLTAYAQHVNYLFATYFNPITHEPMPYVEHPELGCVREPWTVGSHAYVMMRAAEVTGEQRYQLEAERAFDTLLETMHYTESNACYQRAYEHPVEMPSGDLTGNAYGAVAAWKLYEATGNTRWRQVSRDTLNTLLRQTPWHEDRTDAINRELRHTGLFYPYIGASCTTPWETTEANLCITWLLAHDTETPLVPLLLKLSNLNRINSFYFYPAVYGPATRALTSSAEIRGPHFPIEPLYQLENMVGSTDSQGTAPYMAGNAIWNWWLYEALAEANDRQIMALNTASLEDYQEALSGANRNMIVFNPTSTQRDFALRWKHLASGPYIVTTLDSTGRDSEVARLTAEELTDGIALRLAPMEYRRLRLCHDDNGRALGRILAIRQTRQRLAHVYCLLQHRFLETDPRVTDFSGLESEFKAALSECARGEYAQATRSAEAMLAKLTADNQ